ncbi:MAG: beta-ketoacyl synthase N-terminal-like domain-containing protein, partial [Candidatus Binatia bacterium]
MEPIVVTGIGVVSPLGAGVEPFWEALAAGRTAIAPLRRFAPGEARSRLGAEVVE